MSKSFYSSTHNTANIYGTGKLVMVTEEAQNVHKPELNKNYKDDVARNGIIHEYTAHQSSEHGFGQ